jgi:hypothetical protein
MFLHQLAAGAIAAPGVFRVPLPVSPTRGSASIWIYLWDIVDEGYDAVLERLRDHRLTSISVATAYHAGKFLAPHNPKRKVVFLEDGTVMFRPNASLYGRITPREHTLVSAGHDLREARREADRHRMQVRSWVVCCHNTPMGTAHPDIVTRTAFDDPLYHNLCPSNEEVRTYLRALVRDVASHGVDRIELEALQFQGYAHGFHHEREGIALSPATRFLLGLCFCESCRKSARAAGLDLLPLREFTRTTLERLFAEPESANAAYPSVDRLPADLFAPFLAWRTGVVRTLLEDLHESSGNVPLRQMMHVDTAAHALVSVDPAASAGITGGILALGYVKDGTALREPLANLLRTLNGNDITLGFQVGMPESGGRAEFLDRMNTAKDLGVSSFNFYNYGFIPLRNLDWIADAVPQ